jgi:hypothetical protein
MLQEVDVCIMEPAWAAFVQCNSEHLVRKDGRHLRSHYIAGGCAHAFTDAL